MNEQTNQTSSNAITNVLSFASILNYRRNFRTSGTKSGSDFNYLDTPGQKYFKLFFYFNNNDDDNINPVGLLSPTWMLDLKEEEWYLYQSAWTYLKLNCEDERADKLKLFVTLLSNINSQSPWYFSELSGLDSSINRKYVMEENFIVENKRPKISIKCLPDAYDDRIGTLLDLYRSIVWSWIQKKEMVPANLRKFDMGILVFETPTAPFHVMTKSTNESKSQEFAEMDPNSSINSSNSNYKTSYKYYELHNCEFDYNSPASTTSSFNNKEGNQLEYTIDIHFDDCYETRYNESLLENLGDLLLSDLYSQSENLTPDDIYQKYLDKLQDNITHNEPRLQERTEFYANMERQPSVHEGDKELSGIDKFMKGAMEQAEALAKDAAKSFTNRLLLGNLFTLSLSSLGDLKNTFESGNVLGGLRTGKKMMDNMNLMSSNGISVNLFGQPTKKVLLTKDIDDNLRGNNLATKKILPTVSYIGNLFQAGTLANNI
jgi:hypothetical protein